MRPPTGPMAPYSTRLMDTADMIDARLQPKSASSGRTKVCGAARMPAAMSVATKVRAATTQP